jgi:hypothetical protein
MAHQNAVKRMLSVLLPQEHPHDWSQNDQAGPQTPVPIKAGPHQSGRQSSTDQKIAAKPRQGRGGAKKEGGGIHGEKSAFRLDKWPRGKIAKRAEGGNVDDEHFSPLPSGRGRTAGHGVSDVAGTPGDVGHMLGLGSRYALSKGAEWLGLISPELGARMRESASLSCGRSDLRGTTRCPEVVPTPIRSTFRL